MAPISLDLRNRSLDRLRKICLIRIDIAKISSYSASVGGWTYSAVLIRIVSKERVRIGKAGERRKESLFTYIIHNVTLRVTEKENILKEYRKIIGKGASA